MFRIRPAQPLDRRELQRFVGMLIADHALLARFLREPEDTITRAGVQLTSWEIKELRTLLEKGGLPSLTGAKDEGGSEHRPPTDASH